MTKSGYIKFGVGLNESEKRDHIQAAAKKIFGQAGYQKTTVKDIIAEAGISRQTYYSYFKSKDDILIQFLDRFIKDIKRVKNLENPDQLQTVEELRDQIVRLTRALLWIIIENRDLIKVAIEGLVMDDQVLAPRSEKILDTLSAFIKEYLDSAQNRGFIHDFDTELLSSMLLGIYIEMVRKHILKNDDPPIEKLV
ncbi:MAG: TetR/AcrR family transcriptional regulator, partial [Desulfobacterales bacterium]|nr:TetR/AcrR family transcriptional regulator [Desulfobacterales bacterium]